MKSIATYKQPWLRSAVFDTLYILSPGFIALFVTLLLPDKYKDSDAMPLIGWIVLVLLIDVAHVYSTLFRTYWDKERFTRHKTLFLAAPVICYVAGVLLYTLDSLAFWRALAYLAVYHFIRQQYGFMRLYSRSDDQAKWESTIDNIAIYSATLYPIIYWHCSPGRNFDWFVRNDFLISNAEPVRDVFTAIYFLVVGIYAVKELYRIVRTRAINVPKLAVVAGTFLTWYFGIVYFNGDLTFTLLNVVTHGIPYIALVWLFRKREERKTNPSKSHQASLLFFLLSIIAFAFVEEGMWDGLVWREHKSLFAVFNFLPPLRGKEILSLVVPLLSLPQATHYVLDGFIWKKQKRSNPDSQRAGLAVRTANTSQRTSDA